MLPADTSPEFQGGGTLFWWAFRYGIRETMQSFHTQSKVTIK